MVPAPRPRSWLREAIRTTTILALPVFAMALVLERDLEAALAIALVGASVGGALGTLEYRLPRLIAAGSRRGLGLWACSVLWALPLLVAALHLGPFRTQAPDGWGTLGLALAIAAGLTVVSLTPLPWLQGRWGRPPPPS
jgi:hypothetical protein